ncbi:MAG: group III truncated hemoglobin [Bacteroidota bacterium]
MQKDIENRADIQRFVDQFYGQAKVDPVIGYIFMEVADLNWETHMPRIYDFWEMVLLGNIVFDGNPMLKHIQLDRKERLMPEHFTRWIALFCETIDQLFAGKIADLAKTRARSIGGLMQHKLAAVRK